MNGDDDIIAQDVGVDDDDAFQPGPAVGWNQAEIEELLYTEDRPPEERLARLRELRDEAMSRESTDFGDNDPRALLTEIVATIARLERAEDSTDTVAYDNDPLDHRESLAPDSDEMFTIEEQDDEALEDEDDNEDDSDAPQRKEGED
ncbi:MAG: hypothetical protein JWN11_1072 [Hyphomicrobiales bacterium]|nr:hypothetical protein [Hyphomicrobiales bacterium]